MTKLTRLSEYTILLFSALSVWRFFLLFINANNNTNPAADCIVCTRVLMRIALSASSLYHQMGNSCAHPSAVIVIP